MYLTADSEAVAATPTSQKVSAAPSPRLNPKQPLVAAAPHWRRGRRWHLLRQGRRSYHAPRGGQEAKSLTRSNERNLCFEQD